MNLANKLTVFRIILVPIMVIVSYIAIPGEFLGIPTMFWIVNLIFCIAAITDKLDGYIARSRNQITTFGKFLDPIADKLLVLAAMVILVELNKLPAWVPIIILFREFIVSGYRLVAVQERGNVIAANFWGKLKTVTQMIAIILSFIDINTFGQFINGSIKDIIPLIINILATGTMFVCVIATIFSGWEYVKSGKDILLKDM